MMSSLMDGIAVYDNAADAIGYSVYSYAAQMYENSSDTKFIAVDGVKPSRETMADGSYPLLSSTSIVYTDKASQNTKEFAEWAVSRYVIWNIRKSSFLIMRREPVRKSRQTTNQLKSFPDWRGVSHGTMVCLTEMLRYSGLKTRNCRNR